MQISPGQFRLFNYHVINHKKLESKDEQISKLETDLDSKTTKISQLETDLDSKTTKISKLETDLDSKTTKISQLETDLDSKITKISKLETDLSSKLTKISQLETDLDSKTTEISHSFKIVKYYYQVISISKTQLMFFLKSNLHELKSLYFQIDHNFQFEADKK